MIYEPFHFGREAGRIAEIETDILFETGAVINALPFRAGAYRERTPLMRELARRSRPMMPEAAFYLSKARNDLDQAVKIAAIELATVAARSAY